MSREELEAWREQTTGAFAAEMFEGDRFFVNTSAGPLLQRLSREFGALAGVTV